MEQINKVELLGIVGQVKKSEVGGTPIYNFSLATNYLYGSRGGTPVIETTWHRVMADGIGTLDGLECGAYAHVFGRIRSCKHSDASGAVSYINVVLADRVEIIQKGGNAE